MGVSFQNFTAFWTGVKGGNTSKNQLMHPERIPPIESFPLSFTMGRMNLASRPSFESVSAWD
jgi:hypothetical protein